MQRQCDAKTENGRHAMRIIPRFRRARDEFSGNSGAVVASAQPTLPIRPFSPIAPGSLTAYPVLG